ncbi:uncharacterized protein LOC129952116 [Eupeodes corollae]|uniref:uncharacterized protein LOC129952116 n=1 Tax=Eupeodes corollae TaxID=290404 RepID=UPI0024900DAE|nr:uncharacterized protein LOC129952116 [Eupeodes corollae]
MISTELFFEGSYDEVNASQQLKIRRALRDSSNPMDLDEHIFIQNFRLSKQAFLEVLNDIGEKLKPIKSQQSIPNVLKLAAVLKFFAQGSYQLSVGNDFNIGMAQPTVSVVLSELLGVLENYICPKWIKFPYSQEEERRAKIYFFEKCGIPNVVGAVDGTHVKILGPKKDLRHVYYNRKGYYSINAMLVRFVSPYHVTA